MAVKRVVLLFGLAAALCAGDLGAQAKQPAAGAGGVEAPATAIRAGQIHLGDGSVIRDGTILVRGGKIVAVGSDLKTGDARIFADLPHAVITPGLIDADASIGLAARDRNEEAREVLPAFTTAAAVDTADPRFRRWLRAGITSVFVGPGMRGVIGGYGSVVKTTGGPPESVELREAAGLRVSLGPEASSGNRAVRGMESSSMFVRRPTTRMGTVWLLRHAFSRYRAGGSDAAEPMPAEELLVLRAVARGKLPIRFHARNATDIYTALRLAAEFDDMRWDVVIDEATEGYRVADALAKRHARVVLGPLYAAPRTNMERREGYATRTTNAAILHRAGVGIAFRSGGESDPENFRTNVGRLVADGLPHAAAVRALTLEAARILGVAERVGSLEVGKDADLVVFSGDPLSPTTRVLGVMVDGRWEHVFPGGVKNEQKK